MTSSVEGTIQFWLKPDHPYDWYSNSVAYDFPPEKQGDIEVTPVKNSDRTLTVSIKGLAADLIELSAPIPHCQPSGLFVAVTWNPARIALHLNGKEAQHFDILP